MSEEVAVAIPEPAAVETKEGIIPDGLLQDPSVAMAGGDAGMGTLANAAVDAKRPGEHIEDEGSAAKKARYSAADPAVWESLMNQVRTELRSMTSDECFSRALELQMLARSEVGARSQHLSNAMDLMATNQQVVESPRTIIKTRNPPNMSISAAQQRATKADREVSKQKPIKTNKAAPVPCMKMTPPLPPRCEVDNAPNVELPQFCQLVNFPTARYYGNCVMCDEAEFPIPKQNKGVCNNCDVAIWVVNPSGMNIKWCKGCKVSHDSDVPPSPCAIFQLTSTRIIPCCFCLLFKNFRKWIDFGVKVCAIYLTLLSRLRLLCMSPHPILITPLPLFCNTNRVTPPSVNAAASSRLPVTLTRRRKEPRLLPWLQLQSTLPFPLPTIRPLLPLRLQLPLPRRPLLPQPTNQLR